MRKDRYGEHRTAYEKNRQIILKTQDICGICGQPVDKKIRPPHPLSPSIDHIIPLAKGGHPSDLSNLQLAHRWCNRQKGMKLYLANVKENPDAKKEVDNDDLPQHFDWKNYKAKKE